MLDSFSDRCYNTLRLEVTVLEDRVYIAKLFDMYGSLLKDRQREIVNMHYLLDYSLAEIGEELDISRQAAHDALKKSADSLKFFEDKLSLVKNRTLNEKIISDFKEKIFSMDIKETDRIFLTEKLNELEERL